MIHGRLIARAARGAALAALLAGAATTSAHAAPALNGRIAYGADDTLIRTAEGDGTRVKTAFDRAAGGSWATLRLADPAYSPDGRKIAFSGRFACEGCPLATSRIGVIAADGTDAQPTTIVAAQGTLKALGQPAWSADGKTLAFAALDNGAPALYTVASTQNGTPPAKIVLPQRDPADPAYSPDGRLLAYSALDDNGDRRVYVKNLESGQISQVTTGGGRQDNPAFSPDSTSVAYLNTPLAPGGGLGFPELAVRPLRGGAPDILWSNQVEPGRQAIGRPAFSADGKHLAFTATKLGPDCHADVMVVDTDAAPNPRAIACESTTSGGAVDWAARTFKGATRLVSSLPGSNNEGGDGPTTQTAVAQTGRYVAFTSQATNLAAGVTDENGKADVFRRDLVSGKTQLVSADATSKIADGASDTPVISNNGQFVAFRSSARDLVDGFHGTSTSAVYIRDAENGTTVLASRFLRSDTTAPSGDSSPIALSDTGRYLLFSSTAPDADADHAETSDDKDLDLFIWDRNLNATTRLSEQAVTGTAYMSHDGQTVAFEAGGDVYKRETTTTLIGHGKLLGLSDDGKTVLYQDGDALFTRATGEPVHIADTVEAAHLTSAGVVYSDHHQLWLNGTQITHGNGDSTLLAATDGVALITSKATDLTAPLKHHDVPSLFRIDLKTGDAEPVSANADDTADAAPTSAAMSRDGNTIAYTTAATNLVDGFLDGNGDGSDAYAWIERTTAEQDPIGPTIRMTTPADDGLYRQDAVVLADYDCDDEGPSGLKSCDGDVPAGQPIDTHETGEFTFTVRAADNAGNIAKTTVRYRVAAANKKLALASRATSDRTTSANGSSDSPAFSADGRYLVFSSNATDLVANFIDGNRGEDGDVYRRDTVTGQTVLVSAGLPRAGDDGRPRGANGAANWPAISPDGRYVLFSADATNLIAGQTAPVGPQLYLRDMTTGETKVVTHTPAGLPGGSAYHYSFSADGKTVVFDSGVPGLVADDHNESDDVFTYSLDSGAITLVSTAGASSAAGDSDTPAISDDGRRVVFNSTATNLLAEHLPASSRHLYWRDLTTGVTKLVDAKWDKPGTPANSTTSGARISGDGSIVLFESTAGDLIDGYRGSDRQLYARNLAADGPATLVSNAWYDPKQGTGGDLDDAQVSVDGKTVIWWTLSKDVIEGFVDHNDGHGFGDGGDLYRRTLDGSKATLALHGHTPQDGIENDPRIRTLSENGRFATIYLPSGECDCNFVFDGVARADLKRGKLNNVIAGANERIDDVVASRDGRRIAVATTADNLLDGFVDANDRNNPDVYSWYDAPPVAVADSRVTGSLKLGFDATGSEDSDGTIASYTWTFGDGATGEGAQPEHTYADEANYPVTLTVEDDGGNEVSYAFEVVAIKGILTTGSQPIDFIGVDKHLRCSVVRGGSTLAAGGGACGTFVALGGKTYGPPELIDGVEPVTPVGQTLSTEGDVTTLVTTVALGDSGVQVKETDAYRAGKAWYRTDVDLINAGAAQSAIVYRAARCAIGEETARRSLHDAGTEMAGCDGAVSSGRTLAAWLPLSGGARRDAGAADAVFGRIAAGAPLADNCACGAQPDPGLAIGWPVELAADGHKSLASLAAFGPDGSIPLTFDIKADKSEVQPLDDNAFTITLHNPNATERTVATLDVDGADWWDPAPTFKDVKVPGHNGSELRFAVTHRSGQRTVTTTVAPSGEVASLQSTDLNGMAKAGATVVARSIGTAKPNTAITTGPTGLTTDRDPRFQLEASKDDVQYECRFGDAAWAPCDGNPHRPGPLADGPYVLEARAVDGVGADETPARRTFVVDTAAPNTSISSGPHGLITDNRPGFIFAASEAGSHFECRLGGAWFACEGPSYRSSALPDGTYTFEVRAIDAAGNADPTPASLEFTIDTTPPTTVINGVTGKVLGASRNGEAPTAGGSTVALGTDGSAAVAVSCPATGPACDGAVGLAMTPPTANAAQLRAVPENAVTLAKAEFSAQPGQTVSVRLPLPMTVRNTVERVGKMAVFTTIDLGDGRATRGSDVVLTPDPRTARLLDAGKALSVKHGVLTLRIACARKCSGSVKLAGHKAVRYTRSGPVRIRIKPKTKRGKELSVLLKTRLAPAKRLTLTLRAQEARR